MASRVLLTSTTNPFEAKVIKAHLEAEGIDVDLRGALDGPYVFALGGMAEVTVWVPEDQIEDARLVMLATEIDASVGREPVRDVRWTAGGLLVAALVVLVLALVTVGRLLETS